MNANVTKASIELARSSYALRKLLSGPLNEKDKIIIKALDVQISISLSLLAGMFPRIDVVEIFENELGYLRSK